MRASNLDRRIDIQRKIVTASDSGEPQETWATIIRARPAKVVPVRGDEQFQNPQIVGREQVEITIRYSGNVATLTQQDRILYPPLSENSPEDDPATRQIHDILEIHEVGRREGLRIVTLRRSDVTI